MLMAVFLWLQKSRFSAIFAIIIAINTIVISFTSPVIAVLKDTPTIKSIELVTSQGTVEGIRTLKRLQRKTYWQTIQHNLNFALNAFEDYLRENPEIVVDEYKISIAAEMNNNGSITPEIARSSTPYTPIYFSSDEIGILFLNQQLFIADMSNLQSLVQKIDYVSPSTSGLTVFKTNGSTPTIIAFGKSDKQSGQINWEVADPPIDLQVIDQIPSQELGEFTTGLRFLVDGKIWEIVSNLPGIALDAETTNVELLSNQLRTFRDEDPLHRLYVVPSTSRVRIELRYVNDQAMQAPAQTNIWGVNIPYVNDEGMLTIQLVCNNQLIEELNNDLFFPQPKDRSLEITGMIFFQLYWGGRIARHHKYTGSFDPIFELLDLPAQPSLPQIRSANYSLGIIFDDKLYH